MVVVRFQTKLNWRYYTWKYLEEPAASYNIPTYAKNHKYCTVVRHYAHLHQQ